MKYKMYKKNMMALGAAVCLMLSCCVGHMAHAEDVTFMPVSEVQEGMHGYAETVVHGRDISRFDVEVLGVMKGRGPTGGDLILVKVSGPVIDESNGIAQGMSGSPVYIDGKLLGAVAYGFPQSGGRIGMVTPISDMIHLWTLEDKRDVSFVSASADGLVPLDTPLMASGYTQDAMGYLTDKMHSFHMTPYAAAAEGDENHVYPLEAGGSVAASLVSGDLKLGAVGTVTYVDKDHMVAFGHPFMSRGKSGYFMNNSYIFTVIPSQNIPFKLGSVGAEIGVIQQDRGAGISGVSGEVPAFTSLQAAVTDEDLGIEKTLNVRMIQDEALLPTLAATSVYNAVSQVMNRRGEGSVEISYTLYPENENQQAFSRKNLYWSSSDIAERSVDEIYNVIRLLVQNRFEDYPLRRVQVDMKVTEQRRTAQLLDATASPMIVSPGDTIFIRARLEPYRGECFYKDLTFKVPDNQPLGEMMLEIRGGGVVPLPYLIQQQKYNLTDEILERLRTYKDFRDLQDKLKKEDQNNQIVAEILDPEVSMISKEEDKPGEAKIQNQKSPEKPNYLKHSTDKEEPAKEQENAVSRVDTGYVIYGDGQFTFQVMKPADRDRALEALKKKNGNQEQLKLEMKNQEKEGMEEAQSASTKKKAES